MGDFQGEKIANFRKLHESGCFVIPNPWDVGTAKYLAYLGFKALATTSAGLGFAHGVPDALAALPLEYTLINASRIVKATRLPVSVDFQNGYAKEPEEVAANVGRCLETGIAGFSIEDSSGNLKQPLYDLTLATERIQAVRAWIDDVGSDVVLTARCEAWLVNDPVPLQTSLKRLVAYAEAGADCLYAPGVYDLEEIGTLVKAVAPKPLNVLMGRPVPGINVSRLADIGVRRISVGSALNRVAWQAFMNAANGILETGKFDSLDNSASFQDLNQIFSMND